MPDFLLDQFAFAYLALAFFFVLLVGLWIGWGIQAHRAQAAIQAKFNAEMIATRASHEARSKDDRMFAIERTQVEILRAIRETNKALCISELPAPSQFTIHSGTDRH